MEQPTRSTRNLCCPSTRLSLAPQHQLLHLIRPIILQLQLIHKWLVSNTPNRLSERPQKAGMEGRADMKVWVSFGSYTTGPILFVAKYDPTNLFLSLRTDALFKCTCFVFNSSWSLILNVNSLDLFCLGLLTLLRPVDYLIGPVKFCLHSMDEYIDSIHYYHLGVTY